MFRTSLSDPKPINAGWLTYATQLADRFGPAGPAADAPVMRETRSAWERIYDWGSRPLVNGSPSAADAATKLEISVLGGVRR
jgi:hypothetical protein